MDEESESTRDADERITNWLHVGNRESMRFLLQILGYQMCPECDYVTDHCCCVK